MALNIKSGKVLKAKKVVIYGTEGIGKSTLASKFPNPIFIDVENGTNSLEVDRIGDISSWSEVYANLTELQVNADKYPYETIVIDSADWCERLCTRALLMQYQKKGIEDFGYGKGYTYLSEQFGNFLNGLDGFIQKGVNVVVIAHAKMRKFENPDESGAYDRWELKLEKGNAPLLKEWADLLLFCNYKTFIVKDDNGKAKAKGGQRVMYTTHHACWDAKNRDGLKDELPMDYEHIAHIIPSKLKVNAPTTVPTPTEVKDVAVERIEADLSKFEDTDDKDIAPTTKALPEALKKLMDMSGITEADIRKAVAANKYYPIDMPVADYDIAFIEGKLIAGWDKFSKAVEFYKNK